VNGCKQVGNDPVASSVLFTGKVPYKTQLLASDNDPSLKEFKSTRSDTENFLQMAAEIVDMTDTRYFSISKYYDACILKLKNTFAITRDGSEEFMHEVKRSLWGAAVGCVYAYYSTFRIWVKNGEQYAGGLLSKNADAGTKARMRKIYLKAGRTGAVAVGSLVLLHGLSDEMCRKFGHFGFAPEESDTAEIRRGKALKNTAANAGLLSAFVLSVCRAVPSAFFPFAFTMFFLPGKDEMDLLGFDIELKGTREIDRLRDEVESNNEQD